MSHAMSVVLRNASRCDARTLCALRARAIRARNAFYSPGQLRAWILSLTPERLAREIGNPRTSAVIVAESHGGTAGFAWLLEDLLWGIYVEPSKRRRGVGSSLLSAAEAEARGRGQSSLWISASLNSVPFYLANGYTARAPFRFEMQSKGVTIGFEALEMFKAIGLHPG